MKNDISLDELYVRAKYIKDLFDKDDPNLIMVINQTIWLGVQYSNWKETIFKNPHIDIGHLNDVSHIIGYISSSIFAKYGYQYEYNTGFSIYDMLEEIKNRYLIKEGRDKYIDEVFKNNE